MIQEGTTHMAMTSRIRINQKYVSAAIRIAIFVIPEHMHRQAVSGAFHWELPL